MTELYAQRAFDAEMDAFAHVSHFGALKTSPTIPVLKANFPGTSLNTTVWNETTANGGSTTVEDGVGKLNTGTNSAGSCKLLSVEQGIFEAGQVTTYQSGVRAATPIANMNQRWGLMTADEQDGLYFEMEGTTFNVVARKGGTNTKVASGSFNGDQSFTPAASNNTYRIFYSAGRAVFCRASSGKLVRLHTMVDSDLPLVDDLDMGLFYEIENSGSTTDSELRVRGASSSMFGQLPTTRANGVEQITDDTVMMLDKSVLVGRGPGTSGYFNVGVNEDGGLHVADYGLEVSRGNMPKRSIVRVVGRNPSVGTTEEDLWEVGDLYNFLQAADTFRIRSGGNAADDASGANAREILLTFLDSSGNITTEAIATAGTSASGWRCLGAIVTETGTYGVKNAGDITIETSGGTIVARIPAGVSETRLAIFSVPNGKKGYVRRVRAQVEGNKDADVYLYTREGFDVVSAPFTPVRRRLEFDQLPGGTSDGFTLESPIELLGKTDIWWGAVLGSGTGAVSSAMEIELVDD